jgi:hypothetical protein
MPESSPNGGLLHYLGMLYYIWLKITGGVMGTVQYANGQKIKTFLKQIVAAAAVAGLGLL